MASITQIPVPQTPRKRIVPLSGLHTPPATVRGHRILSPIDTQFPPIVYPADQPTAPYFSPRTEYFRLATTPTPEAKPEISDLQRQAEISQNIGTDSDDDEIQFLGTAQSQALVVRGVNSVQVEPSDPVRPLFLGFDEAVDLNHSIRIDNDGDEEMEGEWEYVGRTSGTPLREVDEDGACKACGCKCQIERQGEGPADEDQGEREPVPPERRSRRNGTGSTTLSSRVLGNILELLLGRKPALGRLAHEHPNIKRWEDVAAAAGARRADFDRVRHAMRWMQQNLPGMKRRGVF